MTFETHESIMMIMNDAKAYFAHGRAGFVSGHKSTPMASALDTNSANSARWSSTESWVMDAPQHAIYLKPTLDMSRLHRLLMPWPSLPQRPVVEVTAAVTKLSETPFTTL
tara:strand:+ start:427 stop:756 length:330 start_codon:yes stop_codon:yes gene_type:complete